MSNQSNPSNPSNRTPLGRALSRCVLMVATLLLLGSTTGSFAQGPAGRGIDERHDRVVREVERTQQLWDEVNGRVERTSAANLRALVQSAAEVQGQAKLALHRAESMIMEDAGRADDQLRASLALTLRARDMTTRAARQLREDLSQEENARRTVERVRLQHERLLSNDEARRSPLWAQATQLLEQARLQWRENNFEQALRLAQNASNVLTMLEERSGGVADGERVGVELRRTEEQLQRLRERAGDRERASFDRVDQHLRDARAAWEAGRFELATERIRAARRLLSDVDDGRGQAGPSDQIERALERLDAQIERFAERVGDDAPANTQRLLRQAEHERDRARRAVHAGNEAQARQHVRAAADLLARIQKQLEGRG